MVDSSSSFPNIYRLKMSDISNGVQMIYASLFVSHFRDLPIIALFPKSRCHPKPMDQPTLLRRFRNSVESMGKSEVTCKIWRDLPFFKPRFGADNDDAYVLNWYAKRSEYRAHIIVMIGSYPSFSRLCEKRLKHFGHMDFVFI